VRKEPTGDELANQVRSMLPESRHATFGGMADLFTPDEASISQCGVLASLTPAFQECVVAREVEAVRAILDLMDHLLTYPEGRDTVGSMRNSVLTCFLENVLPLPEPIRANVVLGPNIRAFAKRHEPSWLK
jgi:hypothetical protein